MNLCKCNMCDEILEDKNPQTDAIEYPKQKVQPLLFDKLEMAWVCPNCKTDDYLVDL